MKVAIILLAIFGLALANSLKDVNKSLVQEAKPVVRLAGVQRDGPLVPAVQRKSVPMVPMSPMKSMDTKTHHVRALQSEEVPKNVALREIIEKDMMESRNYTQCIYESDKKVLSCKGLIGEVECDAKIELNNATDMYHMWGLSRIESMSVDVKPESVQYYLYPRKLDNSTYLNRTIEIEGRMVDLVLHYNETESVERGIRVPDLKCYEKLVRMFNESIYTHSVEISSDVQVPLFGEILVRDAVIAKRWLWGYGWGGYGGWGWGGLGWGYPYYYYGK